MSTCKREGCGKEARARGLCTNHYKTWRTSMRQQGLDTSGNPLRDTIGDYLPGTREQVAKKSGHEYDWAHKVIRAMHKDRKIFICDYQPPQHLGDRWQPIFDLGKKPDAKLDPKRKQQYARERKTIKERIRKAAKRGRKPAVFAGLLAPLLQQ